MTGPFAVCYLNKLLRQHLTTNSEFIKEEVNECLLAIEKDMNILTYLLSAAEEFHSPCGEDRVEFRDLIEIEISDDMLTYPIIKRRVDKCKQN